MQFEGQISRVHMFFGTRNTNLRSILKPEVNLVVLLRMRSNKITKMAKNDIELQFKGLISRVYMFFGRESEFEANFETGSRIDGVSAHAQ